jgi:7-carboxy-7-deazaguanine synthase
MYENKSFRNIPLHSRGGDLRRRSPGFRAPGRLPAALPLCDTPEAAAGTRSEEMPIDVLTDRVHVLAAGCHSISLTGGEPLFQIQPLMELARSLKKDKQKIFLETNGVLHNELAQMIGDIDIVSMDIKLPSSQEGTALWDRHEKFLGIARRKEVYIKIVVDKFTEAEEVRTACAIIKRASPKISLVLQPNTAELEKELLEKCGAFQIECLRFLKDVRIIPQMHRLAGIK